MRSWTIRSGAFAAHVLVMFLALRDELRGGVAHAAPRVLQGPDVTFASSTVTGLGGGRPSGREGVDDGTSCSTAVENGHEVADSRGSVCSPLALDADTGCCLGAAKLTVSGDLCASSCSDKSCCDSFAKCVVCCHTGLTGAGSQPGGGLGGGDKELPPVSPMHPSMWRKWLMAHDDEKMKRHGGGREVEIRGESFAGGNDEYRVSPFDYCKHRCRSNSAVGSRDLKG